MLKSWLLGILFLSALHCGAQQKDSTEWLLIYYMPYDNDLSPYAVEIEEMLLASVHTPNVRVVIQKDTEDTLGMTRIRIGNGQKRIDSIPEERSYAAESLHDYLLWIDKNYNFNHCALFFLDHGGKPNEIGLDSYPDSLFLTTAAIRQAVSKFNEERQKEIDLIYLQVCSKASLETLYEFHDLCDFTLASQQLLGAPNYYYGETIRALNEHPEMNGSTLAAVIAKHERVDMYQSLTCVNNAEFETFRNEWNNFFEKNNIRKYLVFTKIPNRIEYAGDRYWDLVSFLESLHLTRRKDNKTREELIRTIREHLLEFAVSTQPENETDAFSGISIAALSQKQLETYAELLFYKAFQIDRWNLN